MTSFYSRFKRSLVTALCMLPLALMGQTAGLTGIITDAQGAPLPGATVQIDGTPIGTVSDIDGMYLLADIEAGTYTIAYTYIGYKRITEQITFTAGQTVTKNMTMQDDALLLDEAVVVGYGKTQVKDLTGSVTAISSKNFTQGSVTTPEQLITGKVAGVQITSNSGMPGSGSRIRIRGGTSINASNDPLIVIDGVPLDNNGIDGAGNALNLINPDDIETITVLKDASAAAIYGSRAANGVIIITTKRGTTSDKVQVEFNTQNSFSQVANTVDVLSADEFRELINSKGSAGQKSKLGTESTDWQNEIYRLGFGTDNDLTLSGGIKKLPYRANLEYSNENGVVDRSQLSRYGLSLAVSPSLIDNHLIIEGNGKAFHTDNLFADQAAIESAVNFDPTQPVTVDDQTYGGYFEWVDGSNNLVNLAPKNPLGLLYQKDDVSDVNRFVGNLKLDYKFHFLPQLHGIINVGGDFSRSRGTVIIPEEAASSFNNATGGGVNNQYEQIKNNKLFESYFNYVRELKSISSKVDLTGGYSYQGWYTERPAFAKLDFDGDTVTPVGIPFETKNTLISFYGRLNYNLKEKYMLTATLREDASSRFSPDNRWGLFPSVALAWRVTEEDFLKNSGVYIKLRAGYGITGQQDILANDYPYIANYDSSTATAQYQFGDVFYYLLRPDGYDPNIKWEETTSYNAGIDFGFVKDRISGSIDVYKKITEDLLATVPVPAGTNFTNQILTNVGSMENQGVEVNINIVAIDQKDLDLQLGLNGTANQNELTKITLTDEDTGPGILTGGINGGISNTIQIHSVGYATNTFYAYEQMYDEDGNPIEGAYVDQNGDSLINQDDLIWGENPTPDFYFGFNATFRYKKWSAGFSLRGEVGNYIYNNVNSTRGIWQNVPTTGTYLQNLVANYNETEFQSYQLFSDYYIEKASFARMDYFNVAYNFGSIMKEKLALTVSAVVQNVFVVSPYTGIDPEIAGGIDKSIYPRPRIYSLNINLKM